MAVVDLIRAPISFLDRPAPRAPPMPPPPNEQNLSPAPSGDRTTIYCIYCDKPQEVSARAQSISCKFCNKRLTLKDESISTYAARRSVETVGIVTVEKRGNVVVTNRIVCGGLIVRGKVKGNVLSRGPVLVGPEAEIKGDITAPSLAVGAGAILEGHYAIGRTRDTQPDAPERAAPEPD
jgi:hypothetical protein